MAAIDIDVGAADELGPVRREKGNRIRNVLGRAPTAERNLRAPLAGIMGNGGLIGSPLARPYLHFTYNFLVVVPMVLALLDQTKLIYQRETRPSEASPSEARPSEESAPPASAALGAPA